MTTDTETIAPPAASEKQVAFIKALLKERGLDPEVNAAMTKKAASALISTLLAMPKGKTAGVVATVADGVIVPASEKQVAFIVKLWGERYPESSEEALAAVATAAPKLSKAAASKQISELLAIPKPPKLVKVVEPEYVPAGEHDPYLAVAKKGDVHVLDGEYIRIHQRQGSKKLYAARAKVIKHAVWGTNDDGTAKILKAGEVKWVSAWRLIEELSEATKATAEESAAFGKMLGRCVYCSLKIDTPESVSVGYGPVCAATHKLPWGEVA